MTGYTCVSPSIVFLLGVCRCLSFCVWIGFLISSPPNRSLRTRMHHVDTEALKRNWLCHFPRFNHVLLRTDAVHASIALKLYLNLRSVRLSQLPHCSNREKNPKKQSPVHDGPWIRTAEWLIKWKTLLPLCCQQKCITRCLECTPAGTERKAALREMSVSAVKMSPTR